ncbi:MAG: hypothetical protein QOE58_1942 [Actinomycetota bacterium]|jgi:hypothetical protein|nr:hypothetical protein [Actinomycetota bacterium]
MTPRQTSARERRRCLRQSFGISLQHAKHYTQLPIRTTFAFQEGIRCWLCWRNNRSPALRRTAARSLGLAINRAGTAHDASPIPRLPAEIILLIGLRMIARRTPLDGPCLSKLSQFSCLNHMRYS